MTYQEIYNSLLKFFVEEKDCDQASWQLTEYEPLDMKKPKSYEVVKAVDEIGVELGDNVNYFITYNPIGKYYSHHIIIDNTTEEEKWDR